MFFNDNCAEAHLGGEVTVLYWPPLFASTQLSLAVCDIMSMCVIWSKPQSSLMLRPHALRQEGLCTVLGIEHLRQEFELTNRNAVFIISLSLIKIQHFY